MLKNLFQVRKATVGLSPDVNYDIQLKSWLKDHHKKEKREYSEEEKKIMIERLEKGRKLKETNLRGQATFNF